MAETSDDDFINPFEDHLGYLLRRASNAVMGELAQRLEAAGLKISEASILLLIEANPGTTQSELGRALGIKRSNMVPLSAGLLGQGLIERKRTDGRSQGLALTPAGTKACAAARRIMGEQEEHLLKRLGGSDRSAKEALSLLWAADQREPSAES